MNIQSTLRRECGNGQALDLQLTRPLSSKELSDLALICKGNCRPFGSLIWIEFPFGKITATTNTPRLTIRLTQSESASTILKHLRSLPNTL